LPDRLWAVILAGGIGSRFWPASTPRHPKQLLRLASDKSLIQETIDRIVPLIPLDRVRILTGAQLVGPIRDAVPALTDANFLIEHRAAGTAPILTWAATEIERIDSDAVMVSLHADHVIAPAETFRDQVAAAASLATAYERLFTLGARPIRPETGYGYIRVGAPLPRTVGAQDARAFEVSRFVEKPDAATATDYVADGGFLWNTGIFIWRVRDLLDQIGRHTPEIAELIPFLRQGDSKAFFDRVPTLSIDEGLLERSDRVGVLPAAFDWDDVGAWNALFRTRTLDSEGNVAVGSDVYAIDSTGCAIYSDGGPVVAFGVEDLIVVRAGAMTFVTHRSRSADLKSLLARLPERLRDLDT